MELPSVLSLLLWMRVGDSLVPARGLTLMSDTGKAEPVTGSCTSFARRRFLKTINKFQN